MSKKSRKKVVKITAGVALLASLAVGVLFSTIDDITPEVQQASLNEPAVVMDIDEFVNTTVDDEEDENVEEKKTRVGFLTKIKQAVMSLPSAVRLLIVTPLWLIGTGIMAATSILGRTLMASPIGAFIVSTLVGFVVLLGMYAATAKMLFPDVPLKKLMSKGNIITLFVIALALAGGDAVAPLFWSKYALLSGLLKFCVGVLVICVCLTEVNDIKNKLGRGDYVDVQI